MAQVYVWMLVCSEGLLGTYPLPPSQPCLSPAGLLVGDTELQSVAMSSVHTACPWSGLVGEWSGPNPEPQPYRLTHCSWPP